MSPAQPTCACGKPATLLCDHPRPFTREEVSARLKAGLPCNRRTATCDRPLCSSCTTQVGVSFACGRGTTVRDTQDRCPEHAPPPAPPAQRPRPAGVFMDGP